MKRAERGASVPEFVLILVLIVPLAWGLIHLAFVFHVRNTLTAAASDGARVAATYGATDRDGIDRARAAVTAALDDHHADDIQVTRMREGQVGVVRVQIESHVSFFGSRSPGTRIVGEASAVIQEVP